MAKRSKSPAVGAAQVAAPAGQCPCGRLASPERQRPGQPAAVRPYADCCGRWHSGALALLAPDAESLMRSRYSAYVLGLHGYLLATWHASTRPPALEPDPPGLQWLGLEVRHHRVLAPAGATPEAATHAEVEFVARHKLGDRAQRLHEISRFERDAQGRWQYLDGRFDAAGPGPVHSPSGPASPPSAPRASGAPTAPAVPTQNSNRSK